MLMKPGPIGRAAAACACGPDLRPPRYRDVATRVAEPPPLPKPDRRRPKSSERPFWPCRAGGNPRLCVYPSTSPRLAALSRDRGLSLNFSVAPRKARQGHAAGAMFDFRWENNISAGRFSQTVFPQRQNHGFPAPPAPAAARPGGLRNATTPLPTGHIRAGTIFFQNSYLQVAGFCL